MCRQHGGFSLYELLITLALAALLVSIGLPSFSSLLARSQQAVEINALFHAFHLARRQSIMRRKVVSLCSRIPIVTPRLTSTRAKSLCAHTRWRIPSE